jgi:hypothetical protein
MKTPAVLPPQKASQAREAFDHSIKDAQQLLDHRKSLGHPLPHTAECSSEPDS